VSTADQLADIEAQMARWERRHLRAMWRWRTLRRQRDALRVVVEREEAAEMKQARKWLGRDVRRSA
jgi:hypothetical protein